MENISHKRRAILGGILAAVVTSCGVPLPPEPIRRKNTRVGLMSCYMQHRTAPLVDDLRSLNPDAVVFGGDNVYGDLAPDGSVITGDPWGLPVAYSTLANDDKHRSHRALRAEAVSIATWDDHDYGTNDGDATYAHKEYSKSLFMDAWSDGPSDPRWNREGVYSAKTVQGDVTVRLIALDLRSFRSPWTHDGTQYVPDPSPSKTMLGADQWTWLENEIRNVTADVVLLVSSMTVLPQPQSPSHETWALFPSERQRLLTLIEQSSRRLVILSGDVHMGLFHHDPQLDLYELTSSGVNRASPDNPWSDPLQVGKIVRADNFGMVEIDPNTRKLSLAVHSKDTVETLTVSF